MKGPYHYPPGTNLFAPVPRNAMGLTARQCDVLKLLLDGNSNKDIARTLKLSEGTVKVHVTDLLHELEVPTRFKLYVAVAKLFGQPALSTFVESPERGIRPNSPGGAAARATAF
jgi:DNA-binding CsgD family transcriptional regulator